MADIVENPTYFIDTAGDEHQIFPMTIGEIPQASRLFSKLNSDMYAGLNLPSPMYHDRGKLKGQMKIDRKTKEPILDYTAYNAMMQLVSMATHEEEQEFNSWVNMTNIIEILDLYRGVSEVKKKDSSGKSDGDLNSLIAALVENTSETRETISRYTIGQLESLAISLSKNHKDTGDTLEDEDAMAYLLSAQNGGGM